MNKLKHLFRVGIAGVISLMPLAAFAAAATIQDVLKNLGPTIQLATTLVVSLSLLAFFWGLAMYIFGAGDTEKRKKGIPLMAWGIVAIFVMLSIVGIINILQGTFQVGGGSLQIPKINK